MNRRLNINLPEETIRTIDMVIQDEESSEDIVGESPAETLRERLDFINEAIQYYIQYKIEQKTSINLNQKLKEGAIQRAQRDLELAEEWNDLEEAIYETFTISRRIGNW